MTVLTQLAALQQRARALANDVSCGAKCTAVVNGCTVSCTVRLLAGNRHRTMWFLSNGYLSYDALVMRLSLQPGV